MVAGRSESGRGRRRDIVERWGSKMKACMTSMVSGPLVAVLHVVCPGTDGQDGGWGSVRRVYPGN